MTSRDSPCSSTFCQITETSGYRNGITCINAEVSDNWKSFPVFAVLVHEYHLQSNKWQNSSWAISNRKRWCCDSAALNMPVNLENSAVATGLEKVNFHSNPKERQFQTIFKLPHNCTHLHASKVMLKILQVRVQQYMNHELPDIQAGFRKGRGSRDYIANIHWIIEKAREFQKKKSPSAFLTTPKPLSVRITTNCGKFFKR